MKDSWSQVFSTLQIQNTGGQGFFYSPFYIPLCVCVCVCGQCFFLHAMTFILKVAAADYLQAVVMENLRNKKTRIERYSKR